MNYCPHCNNLLVPKGDIFECRICNREFIITENEEEDYKVVKPLEDSKKVDSSLENEDIQERKKSV